MGHMGQISQFLRHTNRGISHYCPACKELHSIAIDEPDPITGDKWQWDGNIVEPTITPSLNLIWLSPMMKLPARRICHYILAKGMIEFLGDCTHEFKGIKMNLPPLPYYFRDKCLNF